MTYDFHTADNAAKPHVSVYEVASGATVAVFYIIEGGTAEAEALALQCIEALALQCIEALTGAPASDVLDEETPDYLKPLLPKPLGMA